MVRVISRRKRFFKATKKFAKAFVSRRLEVRTLTGFAAIAVALLTLTEFLAKISTGVRPALNNDSALIAYTSANATVNMTVIMIDTLLMACLIIFFAGFRQLIIQKRHDLSWITDLAFGAGLVFVALTLIGDAMDGGAALDATNELTADATVIRALTEGHMLLFGSIGCVMTALVAATFAYTTFVSKALAPWTGWVGYGIALINLLAIPTAYNGTDPMKFGSAGGIGVTLLATFPFLAWVVTIGVMTLVRSRKEARALSEPKQV